MLSIVMPIAIGIEKAPPPQTMTDDVRMMMQILEKEDEQRRSLKRALVLD